MGHSRSGQHESRVGPSVTMTGSTSAMAPAWPSPGSPPTTVWRARRPEAGAQFAGVRARTSRSRQRDASGSLTPGASPPRRRRRGQRPPPPGSPTPARRQDDERARRGREPYRPQSARSRRGGRSGGASAWRRGLPSPARRPRALTGRHRDCRPPLREGQSGGEGEHAGPGAVSVHWIAAPAARYATRRREAGRCSPVALTRGRTPCRRRPLLLLSPTAPSATRLAVVLAMNRRLPCTLDLDGGAILREIAEFSALRGLTKLRSSARSPRAACPWARDPRLA